MVCAALHQKKMKIRTNIKKQSTRTLREEARGQYNSVPMPIFVSFVIIVTFSNPIVTKFVKQKLYTAACALKLAVFTLPNFGEFAATKRWLCKNVPTITSSKFTEAVKMLGSDWAGASACRCCTASIARDTVGRGGGESWLQAALGTNTGRVAMLLCVVYSAAAAVSKRCKHAAHCSWRAYGCRTMLPRHELGILQHARQAPHRFNAAVAYAFLWAAARRNHRMASVLSCATLRPCSNMMPKLP